MKLLTPSLARRLARPAILGSAYETIEPFVGGSTQAYGSAGYYEFTVLTSGTMRAKLWGAGGGGGFNGSYNGGGGAFAQGDFSVRAGDTIMMQVGRGGLSFLNSNDTAAELSLTGGQPGRTTTTSASFGGGLVALWRKSALGDITLLLVAGSGGGANHSSSAGRPGVAASGGSRDGSQSGGGTAGNAGATAGTFLRGGAGEVETGAGGGDGYFGGGGGSASGASGSGGGGSSYAHPLQVANSILTAATNENASNAADSNYASPAGKGGISGALDGNPGRIVLLY
ncbi:hypothetical protein JL101_035995 (plasmid) [Skermanella rosea]|uniref:glycine-rich protein n=1 Tax=Skermanella rosea TaxID=1817965 RepID=UPI00193150E6|nr:glycine-rich protein [Skermanella rosea]UEM08056.1 hypothetical protein JL101_035995 [Skermanella rosea]